MLKGNSKPYVPPELPEGVILSDPDSRVMRTQGTPPRQAFNAQAAVNDRQVVLAAQMQAIEQQGIEVLAPPDGNMREGKRPGWEHERYEQMREKLTSERGRKLYAQRKITIEPVFGQIKYNRHIDRFMRTGRAAARSSGGSSPRPTIS